MKSTGFTPPENLLSQKEVEQIADGSPLPASLRRDLVRKKRDGSIRFTFKGRQFYRIAMFFAFLDPNEVDKVRNLPDLLRLVEKRRRARAIADKCRAIRGKQGAEQYDTLISAIRSNDYSAMCDAMTQLLQIEEAGPNVIPVDFKRRG